MAAQLEFLKRLLSNETFRAFLIASGIVGCFFVYGLMQEKVMRGCFGGDVIKGKCSGEKFTYEMCLVLIYCVWYSIFAKFLTIINNKCPFLQASTKDKTQIGWYLVLSVCYISAMVCSNMSLRFINYPTQVIAKSSKPIPVMILGVLIAGKKFTIQKYFFVFLIVIGVILFVFNEKKVDEHENNVLGLSLIFMSLLADGVLGGLEDRIRKATNPTALNFMSSINLFSSLILLVTVFLNQEIFEFYEFLSRHPGILLKIGAAALVGSFGQIFIFLMLAEFGSLPVSIATTTRKFFNVLISVLFLGNPLKMRQWVATAIIFGALFGDILIGKRHLCGPRLDENRNSENLDCEKATETDENMMKSVKETEMLK